MTVRTTAKRTIPSVKWLCALALVGCDDPDVELAEDEGPVIAEDEAQDAIIISDPELRELCGLESEPPPAEGPGEFTDEADPALGVCSAGSNDPVPVENACGSCRHTVTGQLGKKVEHWWQFCYYPPSPPSCGCEPRILWNWSCEIC
jgi:hypothetical protein